MSEPDKALQDVEGTVKWFDPKKGYGFIVGPEGQDIFVHYSQIEGDGFRVLSDGSAVRYDAIHGDKGWHATRVVRTEVDVTVRPIRRASRTPRR
ncbi:MAG: cold shock domain-containing protein [Planctomycetota bacterium]|jgi:CspA family cold shock protein